MMYGQKNIKLFTQNSVSVQPQIRQVRFEETARVAALQRNDRSRSVKTVTQFVVLYSEQVIKKARK